MVTGGSYSCGEHSITYRLVRSLCCTPETNIALYVTCTSVRKKKHQSIYIRAIPQFDLDNSQLWSSEVTEDLLQCHFRYSLTVHDEWRHGLSSHVTSITVPLYLLSSLFVTWECRLPYVFYVEKFHQSLECYILYYPKNKIMTGRVVNFTYETVSLLRMY